MFAVEVACDGSSENYFCVQKCDELPRAVCVSVYIKKHSVCSRCLDGGRSGGGERCVCMCVCGDSLWRKLDMCRITRDTEDGWLVLEVAAMASSDPLNEDTSEVGPVSQF